MQILTDIIFQYLSVKTVKVQCSTVQGEGGVEGVEKSASRTTLIGKQTLCAWPGSGMATERDESLYV